jgi:molybdopterin-guanine dinucleotide biosynthesis protein A
MPIINLDLIQYMMEQINLHKSDGAVCYNSNFIEPMYAFYSINMLDIIDEEIKEGNYRLLNIIRKSKMHYVEDKIVQEICKDMNVFTNLNYKEDLNVLEKVFSKDVD